MVVDKAIDIVSSTSSFTIGNPQRDHHLGGGGGGATDDDLPQA